MRNLKLLIFSVSIFIVSISCKLDNYDAPDAQLVGNIFDKDTKELVQQDIIRGTTIKLIEHGYDNVQPQYLRVKTDGTYANTLLFANTYTIQPDQRNFVQLDEQEFSINGGSTLDFLVQPYIRVKNAKIVKSGTKIIATFNLDQTVTDQVSRIGLYAHSEPIVGEPIRMVASEIQIGRNVQENELFTLEINAADYSATLLAGKQYFFRIGAVINIPEAKFNYAPAVRLALD